MKRIHTLIFFAILLLAPAVYAQTDDNPVLAKGNPPLTKGLVDRAQLFFEWTLEGKFTAAQRNTLEKLLIEQWKTGDAESIKATVQLMGVPDAAVKLSDSDRQIVHDKFREAVIQMIEKDPDNELNKMLAKVKDSKSGDILDQVSGGPVTQGTATQIPVASASALAGEWLYRIRGSSITYTDGAGNYADPSGELSGYKLKADGTYEHGYLLSSSLYGCNTKIFGYETGVWGIQGNRINFQDKTATLTSKDTCNKSGNYVKKRDLSNYSYPFRIERDEYGVKMVLILGDGGEEPYYKQDPGQMGW